MKTRIIKKDLLEIEISQYDGPYSLVSFYKFSNLKIFEGIDVWVMKDFSTNQATGLKISANFKQDYDKKNIDKAAKLHLEEMNHTHLFFKDLGKEKVYQKTHDFIELLCKLEGIDKGFFDFMLHLPIFDNEIKNQLVGKALNKSTIISS